jgi:hypothetical protein
MPRVLPLAALAVAAIVPPVVACKAKVSAAPDAATASASPDQPSPVVAGTPASASASASAIASPPSASAVASAPRDPRAECQQLEGQIRRYVATHRACSGDSDCVHVNMTCSCGTYISRGSEAGLDRLERASSAANCAAKLQPRSCPTCAPPPPPHCTNGRCDQ